MLKAGKQITSPNGIYKEQFILSSNSTVYYNDISEYYLYKASNRWLVSIKLHFDKDFIFSRLKLPPKYETMRYWQIIFPDWPSVRRDFNCI